MTTLPVSSSVVNLFADEWQSRQVAELAHYALRQPGGIAQVDGLSISSYTPKTNARIWLVEDAQGNILAEEPSLYKAIHQVAHGEVR